MRPSKIHNWIIAFEQFVESSEMFFVLTDNDIRLKVNDTLKKEDRIAVKTFEKWKAGQCQEAEKFQEILQKALIVEKENLMKGLMNEDKAWTKYAWILERKFLEWNLKAISEVKTDVTTKIEPIKIELIDAND